MREIKFRAWNKNTNELLEEGFHILGEVTCFDIIGMRLSEYYPDKTTLEMLDCVLIEQFTGLKDKNGKEIYEGDIVRILYTDWVSKMESDTRTLEQYLIDIASIGSIVFNENSWEVYFGLDKYGFDSYSNINPGKHGYIEIIGNIHDSKEQKHS